MKRTLFALLSAGLAFAASAAPLRAQEEDSAGSAPPMMQGQSRMSAAKLKDKLGLTDDQVSKLDAARKAHQEAVKPLRERMKADIAKLREQVKSKASDAEIKATLDDLDGAWKGLRGAMEKLKSDSAAILTPTQQAKMTLWHVRRMRQAWRRRRNARGGMRPAGGPPPQQQ